ncbi:hypothetical protein J6590_020293 [Homalodisca vitripennis]|nr:hypothetical protein J6590_020293 [Homalodisca vitripennis]
MVACDEGPVLLGPCPRLGLGVVQFARKVYPTVDILLLTNSPKLRRRAGPPRALSQVRTRSSTVC